MKIISAGMILGWQNERQYLGVIFQTIFKELYIYIFFFLSNSKMTGGADPNLLAL